MYEGRNCCNWNEFFVWNKLDDMTHCYKEHFFSDVLNNKNNLCTYISLRWNISSLIFHHVLQSSPHSTVAGVDFLAQTDHSDSGGN